MDIRRTRILFGLAEAIIFLAAIFLLLDAVLGFTGHQDARPAQPQAASQNFDSTDLSTSCTGGFANQRTVNGMTQVAAHGTPFNAFKVTLTDIGISDITIYSINVDLLSDSNHVFAKHHADLGNGTGITLAPGQTRQIVEAYGIKHPVTSCEILSWQS